eukprot:s3073_g12.t1
MPRIRIVYRNVTYRPVIHASNCSVCVHELQRVYAMDAYRNELWLQGQFADIVEALECVYGYEDLSASVAQATIRKTYAGARFTLTVPLRLFFRATLTVADLFVTPEIQARSEPLDSFRGRWKRLVVVGSDHTAEVFAWGHLWTLDAAVPRPVENFAELWTLAAMSLALQHPAASKDSFRRIWFASAARFAALGPSVHVHAPAFNKHWSLTVATSSAWVAQISLENAVLEAIDNAELLRRKHADLEAQFAIPSVPTVPESNLFHPEAFDYELAPASRAPRHYPSDA